MDTLDKTIKKLDRLLSNWKPDADHSFQEHAQLLTLAYQLKRQTAEEALKLPRGFSRGLLIRLRHQAVRAERLARAELFGHAPSPGRAA